MKKKLVLLTGASLLTGILTVIQALPPMTCWQYWVQCEKSGPGDGVDYERHIEYYVDNMTEMGCYD